MMPAKPTAKQQAQRVVESIMHDAHVAYQKAQLARAKPDDYVGGGLAPCEVKGLRLRRQRALASSAWRPEWSSGLRPNFWKAYFETLRVMGE